MPTPTQVQETSVVREETLQSTAEGSITGRSNIYSSTYATNHTMSTPARFTVPAATAQPELNLRVKTEERSATAEGSELSSLQPEVVTESSSVATGSTDKVRSSELSSLQPRTESGEPADQQDTDREILCAHCNVVCDVICDLGCGQGTCMKPMLCRRRFLVSCFIRSGKVV